MHPDVQRYLDGELSRDLLSPELQRQAQEWDTLLRDARELGAATAPPWIETRVMASLPAAPRPGAWQGALEWLVRSRAVQLRPATVLAGALALLAALALAYRAGPGTSTRTGAPSLATAVPASAAASLVYVQFTLTAPGAHSVEVAGDFNGWQPARAELRDPEGDGSWSGLVAIPAGVHKYMFVIDGRRWVSDPHAHRFVDDGFGMKNSLIAIAAPARSS